MELDTLEQDSVIFLRATMVVILPVCAAMASVSHLLLISWNSLATTSGCISVRSSTWFAFELELRPRKEPIAAPNSKQHTMVRIIAASPLVDDTRTDTVGQTLWKNHVYL